MSNWKITSIFDDKNELQRFSEYLFWRVKRIVAISDVYGENVWSEAGSGFFIQPNKNEAYFVMTQHQYRSLDGCAAFACHLHGNYRIKVASLFDFRRNRGHGKNHKISEELDVVLIPFDWSNCCEHVRFFGKELYWHLYLEEKDLRPLGLTVIVCGYPNEVNGSQFYCATSISPHLEVFEVDKWRLSDCDVVVCVDKYTHKRPSRIDWLQGFSGGPIVALKRGSDKNYQAAIIGVSQYTRRDNAELVGISLSKVFEEFNIVPDIYWKRSGIAYSLERIDADQ